MFLLPGTDAQVEFLDLACSKRIHIHCNNLIKSREQIRGDF